MRNEFVTPFWHAAFMSLPAHIRHRHLSYMLSAERWELALGALIETFSRLKQGVVKRTAKLPHTPRSAHR